MININKDNGGDMDSELQDIIENKGDLYAPEQNRGFPIKNIDWFSKQRGKIVYRTSAVEPGVFYKLQMMKHIKETKKEIFEQYRGHGIPRGCGEWVIRITPDNINNCIKDELRLFNVQMKYGMRFSEDKFTARGMRMSSLKI